MWSSREKVGWEVVLEGMLRDLDSYRRRRGRGVWVEDEGKGGVIVVKKEGFGKKGVVNCVGNWEVKWVDIWSRRAVGAVRGRVFFGSWSIKVGLSGVRVCDSIFIFVFTLFGFSNNFMRLVGRVGR